MKKVILHRGATFVFSGDRKAVFKFNGGAGALLCSKCKIVIKTGKDFTEIEWKAVRGEANIEAQFCNECKAINRDKQIDKILK